MKLLEDDQTITTYDLIAGDYFERNSDRNVIRHHLDRFIEILRGQGMAGSPVVDLGCGPGYEVATLDDEGFQAFGLDLSWNMLLIATRSSAGKLMMADLRDLPLGESVGGLWCCASLLHLPRKEMGVTLKGLARVLLPDGVIYISLKKGEGQMQSFDKSDPGRKRTFTLWQPDEIDQLIREAGFRIVWASLESPDGKTTWITRIGLKEIR